MSGSPSRRSSSGRGAGGAGRTRGGGSRTFGKGNGGGKGNSGRSQRVPGPPGPGLFHDILLAPDREAIPEARPVVSLAGGEDPAFSKDVRSRLTEEVSLRRRGNDFGSVAELDPAGLLPPRPRRRRREVMETERWVSARPIFVPGGAGSSRASLAAEDVGALHRELSEPGGLLSYLEKRKPRLGADFEFDSEPAQPIFDPERDLARHVVRHHRASGEEHELWVKSGRLSLSAEDRSIRLRISFGTEGDDDASADDARHAAAAEFAKRILPGAHSLAANRELWARIEEHVRAPVLPTGHIAYWNAPNGGAQFHHDSFPESEGRTRQRGVAYAQLTGRTFWLALSIEELMGRVREFVGWLGEGEMPWLRESLEGSWKEIQIAVERRAAVLDELALPNSGVFGTFVNSREFTTFLTDAGHGLLLRPGDALLLPNHGLDRTAMHSVFSASKEPGYALSVAIRG